MRVGSMPRRDHVRFTPCHAGFKAIHASLMSHFIRLLRSHFQFATEIAEKMNLKSNERMIMKKLIGTTLVAIALVGSASSAFAAPSYEGSNEKTELSRQLDFWNQFSKS
jgi:hypothetical protein